MVASEQAVTLRQSAVEFPLMIVISTVYPCNFGCPNCPYSLGNSELRDSYKSLGGDYISEHLWDKMAQEAGQYGAWLRCTGGGEPMMHKQMVSMVERAKGWGCRIWMNTNGSLFGPVPHQRANLRRLIASEIDLIEFSMDAGDATTYAKVRPPISGTGGDPIKRWNDQVSNVKAALSMRRELRSPTRVVVSIIRQAAVEGKLEEAMRFWLDDVGVDDVITRKYLSWDDNTTLGHGQALDEALYQPDLWNAPTGPCVWPFERMNVDSIGRVALCGQDISFRTSHLFPNISDATIREIWTGETFTRYRASHLAGDGGRLFPCHGCSAWFAGVRDWKHGWIQVLQKSGNRLRQVMEEDTGASVEIFTPNE